MTVFETVWCRKITKINIAAACTYTTVPKDAIEYAIYITGVRRMLVKHIIPF